jgi:hypothetical protein
MERMAAYLKPVPRHVAVWWLLSAALAAGSIWGGIELHRQYGLVQEQKEELLKLQRASRVRPVAKPSRAAVEVERHWIALQQELNFSWYPIFAALERTSNPDIAILEFLPDKSTGTLTLRGNARDLTALTTYLRALSNEPGFAEVYLSHQKKIQQGALAVLSFEIRLRFGS